MWNAADPGERSIEHIYHSMKIKSNELYNSGKRRENINHAQLRLNCSKLNAHLFSLHVIDSPACLCGNNYEDSEHYLFRCPLHLEARQNMLQTLGNLIDVNDVTTEILLYGGDNYDYEINCDIFECVHRFFEESNRL